MNEDLINGKREHLEARVAKRNASNESILKHFDVELVDESEEVIRRCEEVPEITLEDAPAVCSECKGRGWVKPMFTAWECPSCYGTTYDLSNPIAIIKWQRLCMDWAKEDVLKNRRALLEATTTREERIAISHEEFYKNANRKD